MTGPLVLLAVFAVGCAWGMSVEDGHLQPGYLVRLLLSSEPAHVAAGTAAGGDLSVALPGYEQIHSYHATAGMAALMAAISGLVVSYLVYVAKIIDPAAVARQLAGTYNFLVEKWQFDNLYDAMFVRPVHVVARWCQTFDREMLDAFLHALSRGTVWVSKWDRVFDEQVVDRAVNVLADATYAVGRSLRAVQTGNLRQYVMSIAVGVVALFFILLALLPWSSP
jgi:NADH-quinone oxidoreductase subunit L